jgi:peptide-methionine (S)-S-oxide reductase
VIRTRVGYAGGTTKRPTYQSIGDHAETLQIDFDPTQVSYEQLLDVFWGAHDPTSRSWSRQYMAAVFTHTEEQRRLAEMTRDRRSRDLGAKVHTAIQPLGEFTLAEDYHQKYYLRGDTRLLREFQAMYPADQELVNSTAAARVNGYLGGYGTRQQSEAEIESLGLSLAGRKALRDKK